MYGRVLPADVSPTANPVGETPRRTSLSRPNITGRAVRAQPALLGASLTCAAALTVLPVGSVAAAPTHPLPPTGASLPGLPGLPGTPAGPTATPQVGPLVLAPPPARTKLR